ncbi:LADA_0B02102g1_1 [Lachancea dasiensis]|uniref:LADA_0B02102g1_1 n=1 Tax=Lachancea dasiensis TaxID=1072105 RepID=A0A1G4IRZ4_9SACH|nr:LADA_0B02102g1_1 [Lachancea dasiensis]
MGYIQFDKVAVPEDNVVSLGLLNRQLQKQQQLNGLQGLLQGWSSHYLAESGSVQGFTSNHNSSKPTETSTQGTRLNGSDASSPGSSYGNWAESMETVLSPNSEALAQWASWMNSDDAGADHGKQLNGPIDSGSSRTSSTSNNSTNKPSLDEELCGLRFCSVPFTELEDLSPCSATSVSPSSASHSAPHHHTQQHQAIALTWPTATTSAATTPASMRSVAAPSKLATDMIAEVTPDSSLAKITPVGPGAPASSLEHPHFRCGMCSASFKVKGYLTRHMKKHLVNKEFRCPFWSNDCRCHPTGEFSRKDTYKTHLKSIHFVYPVGVVKNQRNNSKGRCAACYQEFSSNNEWLDKHVATRACGGLLRIKAENEQDQKLWLNL